MIIIEGKLALDPDKIGGIVLGLNGRVEVVGIYGEVTTTDTHLNEGEKKLLFEQLKELEEDE